MSQMIAMTATIFMMVDSKEEVERLRGAIAETLDGEFDAFQDIVYGPPIPIEALDPSVGIEDPGVFARQTRGDDNVDDDNSLGRAVVE